MKYQLFGLVLIVLAAVPSDALHCFTTSGSEKVSTIKLTEVKYCSNVTECIAYRVPKEEEKPAQYLRDCGTTTPEHTSACAYILSTGADECKACTSNFCNWDAIATSE